MDAETLHWLLSPVALALYGLCIGSFLNVVVHRLPLMLERAWRAESAELLGVTAAPLPGDDGRPLSLSRPRSRCPHCGHVLRWHENIPLLGWLRLGGRCAACRAPIGLRYPLVELPGGQFAPGDLVLDRLEQSLHAAAFVSDAHPAHAGSTALDGLDAA